MCVWGRGHLKTEPGTVLGRSSHIGTIYFPNIPEDRTKVATLSMEEQVPGKLTGYGTSHLRGPQFSFFEKQPQGRRTHSTQDMAIKPGLPHQAPGRCQMAQCLGVQEGLLPGGPMMRTNHCPDGRKMEGESPFLTLAPPPEANNSAAAVLHLAPMNF